MKPLANQQSLFFTKATRPAFKHQQTSELSHSYTILLPENISLSLEPAGALTRLAAFCLDLCILAGTIVLLLYAFISASSAFSSSFLSSASSALLIFFIFLVYAGYYFFFEIFFGGQTPGKRVLQLRVLAHDGKELHPAAGIVRSFMRLPTIFFLPIWVSILFSDSLSELPSSALALLAFSCADWFSIFLDKNSRRLGDIAARTLVVTTRMPQLRGKAISLPPYLSLPNHAFPLQGKQLEKLELEDFIWLEEFAARFPYVLSRSRRAQIALIVAQKLVQKLSYTSSRVNQSNAERFIFEVHCALKDQLKRLYPDLYLE